jgi:hypothetical protein
MIGNAINAKSEALELHGLSSEELDAVSGGNKVKVKEQDYRKQMEAFNAFRKALEGLI